MSNNISQSLLPEFDKEMAGVRTSIERIPNDKLEWRPHPISWMMRDLATHLANLPGWTLISLQKDAFDINPPGEKPASKEPIASVNELLEIFDKNYSEARELIAASSDTVFMQPWTLLAGGKEQFTLPKVAVLRSFVMNHIIHHRAQLGVYLRLNDIPVPAHYGPSADEQGDQPPSSTNL